MTFDEYNTQELQYEKYSSLYEEMRRCWEAAQKEMVVRGQSQLLRKGSEVGITDIVGLYESEEAAKKAWHAATEEETFSAIYYTVREVL